VQCKAFVVNIKNNKQTNKQTKISIVIIELEHYSVYVQPFLQLSSRKQLAWSISFSVDHRFWEQEARIIMYQMLSSCCCCTPVSWTELAVCREVRAQLEIRIQSWSYTDMRKLYTGEQVDKESCRLHSSSPLHPKWRVVFFLCSLMYRNAKSFWQCILPLCGWRTCCVASVWCIICDHHTWATRMLTASSQGTSEKAIWHQPSLWNPNLNLSHQPWTAHSTFL